MRRIILACALAGVLAVPSFGQGVDPLIGTWKINFDKSTMNPPPKSLISTVSKEGDHLISVTDLVTADGQTFKTVLMDNHIQQLVFQITTHPPTRGSATP
jgi:hypothetical protein